MVAARMLLNAGIIKKVGILDCDWHFGDGTENIVNHFQLRSQVFHRTSGSERFYDSEHYQQWLKRALAYFNEAEVELILYQAGADAHRDDPLDELHRATMQACFDRYCQM